jgi:hypothetical protein
MPEKRRATRLTISKPKTHHFSDDLSDIPINQPIDYSNLPDPLDDPPDPSYNFPHPSYGVANCSVLAYQQQFQIPSEIIESAHNLNLSFNDESVDSADAKSNNILNDCPPESFTAHHPPIFPPSNWADCKSLLSVNKKHGYSLGNIYQIAHIEDFNMLDSFPGGSLMSMAHIIHYFQMAAAPLYLINGIIKIISEEVSAAHLNLMDTPPPRLHNAGSMVENNATGTQGLFWSQ